MTIPYVTEDNLTDVALERCKDIPDPRLRQIMQSLIKHVHGFVREIEPTQQEWATAIDWLTRTGKLCSQKRQEFILASDVLGVSMLVDAINNRRPSGATPSTVEGPFHVPNAPPDRERRRHGEGGRRALRASSRARFAASTANRSPARCSISGRPTAKGCTRACATPPARGCAALPHAG
jgi:Catechol dioxygenase N terminus